MQVLIDKINFLINFNKNKIVIIGLDYCPYCKNAIKLVQKFNIPYEYYNIHKDYKNLFDALKIINLKNNNIQFIEEHKTVPVVFFNKKFIGGYSELAKYFN